AGLFTMSDPALQIAVLGGAAVCGLALTAGSRSPLWLTTGLVALAAQTAVTAGSIVDFAPAYVPSTLGVLLAAAGVVGILRRDNRLTGPWTVLLFVATATAGSTLHWNADTFVYGLAGVTLLAAAIAWLLPTRVPAMVTPVAPGVENVGAWIAA